MGDPGFAQCIQAGTGGSGEPGSRRTHPPHRDGSISARRGRGSSPAPAETRDPRTCCPGTVSGAPMPIIFEPDKLPVRHQNGTTYTTLANAAMLGADALQVERVRLE